MSELKFTGTATLTGFPRDKSFNFELDGPDRLIIKAGKEVFVVIEKEAPAVVVADVAKAAESAIVVIPNDAPLTGTGQGSTATVLNGIVEDAAAEEASTGRKPRGPNVKIDESLLIYIDIGKPNPYGKLRGKYYETLKTAVGRPVSWWKETSMVKSLEGSPLTLLKFFLSENAVQLRPAAGGVVGGETLGQPMQQQPIAGPSWSPQGGPVTPNGAPPASFM